MRWALWFAGGTPYFPGLLLIVLGALAPGLRKRWQRSSALVLTALGCVVIVLTATPLPLWLASVGLAAIVASAAATLGLKGASAWLRISLRTAVVTISFVAAALEWPYWRGPSIPSFRVDRLFVIGDSLSAGTGTRDIVPWPQQLAAAHGIRVTNLAVPGATLTSAARQCAGVVESECLVLVEIGGNDLLAGVSVTEFEQALDELIGTLRRPGRTLVMLELPLFPLANGYGAAQRRMATKHGVLLLPKRLLAHVLGSPGATVDGVHLSNDGHRQMAEVLWRRLAPALGRP